MYNIDTFVNDIENEIERSSKKKTQKITIDYYELEKEITGIYFYKIWVSTKIRLVENQSIKLTALNHKINANLVTIYEFDNFLIRTSEKLTKEIYTLISEFDPTIIYKNLQNIIIDKNISSKNYELLLSKKLDNNDFPIIDNSLPLSTDLNESQQNAISLSERKRVSLIWGPPGTGKTRTLSEIIYRAYLRGETVLVLSTSNVAVDQVLLYLDKNIYPNEIKDFLRLGYSDNQTCLKYNRENTDLNNVQILFSTIATAILKNNQLLEHKFDMVIVDETSMVSIPHSLFAAKLAIRNIIFAGDFKQLPPICLTGNNSSLARNIFDYLDIPFKVEHDVFPDFLSLLNTQYRMVQPISDIINELFYHGKLKCGVKTDHIVKEKEVLHFINVENSEYHDSYYSVEYKSYYNPISLLILESFCREEDLLIISPYRAQQSLLSYYSLDKDNKGIKSFTIHRAQGSEAKIVVIDLTTHARTSKNKYSKMFTSESVSNLLNVAISRAKEKVIIIGSLEMIQSLAREYAVWKKLYNIFIAKFNLIRYEDNCTPAKILLEDEKTIIGIDKRNLQVFLEEFKESKAERKYYFSSQEMKLTSAITFKNTSKYEDLLPELFIWGSHIILCSTFESIEKYRKINLIKTSEVLRRISVGHIIDTEEPSAKNTLILHCDKCGANKEIKYSNGYYWLKCPKCPNKNIISESIAKDLRVLYDLKCPECGSEVKPINKKTERFPSFFGCTNYPTCKGTVSFRKLVEISK